MKDTRPSSGIEENINENSEGNEILVITPEKEEEIENELDMTVVNFPEAPKHMQDNEYLIRGYLLNCTDLKRTFKSLFMWHNETINIWSHLLGALFFFALIFYTSIFITNFNSQLKIIKNDISNLEEKSEIIYKESQNITYDLYNSIKDIKISFDNFDEDTTYQESLNIIYTIVDKIKNITSDTYEYLSLTFWDYFSYIKEGIFSLKEKILDLIKLDISKSNHLEIDLDDKYDLNLKKRKQKDLARWPLFVIIHSAILCFIFSACFHSIGTINEKYHDILNRFDYGGISILISGSCYPPYYYFFYYSKKCKYFYLIEITVIGIGTFLYSLTDDFNKPKRRTLRGIIYLIFGLCTGIPILHMAFFGNKIEGYGEGIKLLNWYLGGASYIIGALLYIIRFPEKLFPRKFDYIGASHQIFHVLVFFGALFHFLGSLEAYNYRFKNFEHFSVE